MGRPRSRPIPIVKPLRQEQGLSARLRTAWGKGRRRHRDFKGRPFLDEPNVAPRAKAGTARPESGTARADESGPTRAFEQPKPRQRSGVARQLHGFLNPLDFFFLRPRQKIEGGIPERLILILNLLAQVFFLDQDIGERAGASPPPEFAAFSRRSGQDDFGSL